MEGHQFGNLCGLGEVEDETSGRGSINLGRVFGFGAVATKRCLGHQERLDPVRLSLDTHCVAWSLGLPTAHSPLPARARLGVVVKSGGVVEETRKLSPPSCSYCCQRGAGASTSKFQEGEHPATHTHPSLPPDTGQGAEKWADRQTDEWLALLALVNVLAARARLAAAAASAGAVSVVGKRVKGEGGRGGAGERVSRAEIVCIGRIDGRARRDG